MVSFYLIDNEQRLLIDLTVASLAPNSGLLGNGPEEFALIDQWVHLAESEVDLFTTFVRLMTVNNLYAYNKAVSAYQHPPHLSLCTANRRPTPNSWKPKRAH